MICLRSYARNPATDHGAPGFARSEVVTLPRPPSRFRPVDEVALVTNRPPRTIRTWARLERITTHRDAAGRLLVDLVEAAQLSALAGRRARTPST